MTAIHAPSRRLLPARRLGTPLPARAPASAAALASNATLVARSDLSPTMATFTVLPDGGVPPFMPGQYLALGLGVDGRLVQRPYSAASCAADAALEFAIRLVPGGALTPLLWRLRVGDRLRIGPPKGLFRLADGDGRTHLLLATGTGIAPLVAMARALRTRSEPPRTVVVHGVARADELAFRDTLGSWAVTPFHYAPTISRPAEAMNRAWRGRVGRIDAVLPAIVGELRIDPAETVAYVCGSPAMIEGVTAALGGLGLESEAIRAEPY